MISTAPLYNAMTHRYKGVYPGPKRDQWDAIVIVDGKHKRIGRFVTQDAAARAVAEHYHTVYGENWATIVNNRSGARGRPYRVTRHTRYLYMGDGHKGPKTIVYKAEILKGKQWYRVIPDDIRLPPESTVGKQMWREDAQGWRTMAAALVAIRTLRAMIRAEESVSNSVQSDAGPRLTGS